MPESPSTSPEPAAAGETTVDVDAWLPKYAKVLFEPHRYISLYGGRGAGRSWSVARVLLLRAGDQPMRILCTREFQQSLKDSVHQLLRDQIALLNLPGFVVTDREIRHENGSGFVFLGLRHHPESVKSLEGIDVAWVEEAEMVPEASYKLLIPTIRKPGSQIILTWNTNLETDATYRRFVLAKPPGCVSRKVGWRDNTWFPEALRREKEYLESVDPESAAHVWGGELRKSSAAQILHGKWVIESVEPQASWSGPYFGADFGFAEDPFALVKVYVADDELHVQDEVYRVGLGLDKITAACTEAMPGCEGYVIRADSSRPDSIDYLRRNGLPRIVGAAKGPGSVEDGIAHLRSYRRIVVHPRCRNWIAEARAYSYKVDERSGDILPVIVGKNDHLIDSSRYALEPLIRPRTSALETPAPPRRHVRSLAKEMAGT
jgi:phage terminase large subunit